MTEPLADEPLLSLCIPTYRRARYLDSLLASLETELAGLPFAYEIVISDNASPDDTPAVVRRYADRLPIRYVRHDENRGGGVNWHFVMGAARGTFLMYLADDDAVLGEQLAQTVLRMQADPSIGVAYAPWLLYDLVGQNAVGQFYQQQRDVLVPAGEHAALLDALLTDCIFPEIAVVRRALFHAARPRVNEQAFFAFVHASEYLDRAAVLLQATPFYVSVTRYFADEQREQTGNLEAEHAWDRYRGGLEYILGRAASRLDGVALTRFRLRIEQMIARRLAVAVRLRHNAGRDPVETYYVAYRLKALGCPELLPLPIGTLASLASLSFLASDVELTRDMRSIWCVGAIEPAAVDYLRSRSTLPVHAVGAGQPVPPLSDALVLLARDAGSPDALQPPGASGRNVRVVRESELRVKFPS